MSCIRISGAARIGTLCIALVLSTACAPEIGPPAPATSAERAADADGTPGQDSEPLAVRLSTPSPDRAGIARDQRELAHWQAQFDAALQSHLQSQLFSPEPRTRLASASMLHALRPGALDAGEAGTLAALVADAIDSAPDDAVLLRMAYELCAGSKACDADGMLARLQRIEPHNAAVWLDGLQHAHDAGDADAIRRQLERAASGDRFDLHERDFGASMLGLIETLQLPPMSAAARRAAGPAVDPMAGYVPDVNDLATISVVSVLAARSIPPLQSITRTCPSDPGARWLPACEPLYRLLAASPTLITRRLALTVLVVHGGDAPAARHWREELCRLTWLTQTAWALPGDRRFHREISTLGEIPAMQALLHRRGLPALPPSGWLPRDARMRALVTTGRDPS